MKRNILAILYVAAVCVFLPSCSKETHPQFEHAKLSLKPKAADFGKIPADDPIAFHEVSLKAKNLGKEALHIDEIELPEGFSYELIPPRKVINGGEDAILKIAMDVRKFSGQVAATGYIASNAPDEPRLPVELRAYVVTGESGRVVSEYKQPRIRMEEKTHDFGPIGRTKMVEHQFPFTNVGEEPLKIVGISTMCMCVTAFTTKTEVLPGESAAIVARIEPWKYEGTSPWKTLEITTNDPDHRIVDVTVAANIVDEVAFDPDVVLLPNVEQGHEAKARVKLLQMGARALKIKNVKTSSPRIAVAVSPLKEGGLGYALDISVSPDMPPGKFDEVITVYTNYDDYSYRAGREGHAEIYRDYSRMRLPVRGSVSGTVSVSPQTINFGSCAPGQMVKRKLLVSSSSSDIDIQSISISDPGFRVLQEPVEAGRKYEVTLEFLPEPPEREITDELLISTSRADLKVPVFASVKSGS